MAYLLAAIVMTLSVLESNSPIAILFIFVACNEVLLQSLLFLLLFHAED